MSPKAFYIELPPDASATLALAGRELSHYVRAVFDWQQQPGKAPEAYRLRLGTRRTSFVFRSFLNPVLRGLGDDGFRIVADDTTTTFCAETDKGVLNAAYTFLANVLRVKWVEPGPLGEVLPRREVRPWWPMDLVEVPAFPIRGMHVADNTQGYREEDVRLHLEWMARNRLNHLVVRSNCSYERLRARLVEECRLRGITLEVEVVSVVPRCGSSREDVSLFVKGCVAWVREHPEAEVVGLSPDALEDPCECASCRSMTPVERWSRLLCPALAALRTEFPERQLASRATVGRYDPLVADAECRLGVALMFDTVLRCPWHELGSESCDVPVRHPEAHDTSKGRTANVYLLSVLKEWKSIATAPVTVFENVASGDLVSQPVVNPEVLTRDMTTCRSLDLAGVVVLGHVHSFGSYLLNFNLFARLAWDLEANYRGIWPDLCVKYFGGYSLRVLDFVERLRERGEGTFTEAEWQSLDVLLGPAFGDGADRFTRRYRRVREGFLYLRELARLDAAGARLRRARAGRDAPAALEAARAAHRSFLDAWDIVTRNRGSGMFNTLDVLAKFITRGVNAEALAERFEGFPPPGLGTRRQPLRDYVARLEAEGRPIDEIHSRVQREFAVWRDRFAALAPRLEELVNDVDFGFGRPAAP